MREAAVVHDDRIAIPEIDRRQIARQNLLRLGVIGMADIRVGTLAGVAEQRVQLRIGIVAAVVSQGRKVLRRVDVPKMSGCSLPPIQRSE